MNLGIAGKTFIVTGGTAGLGFATVKCLVAEEANVLVTGRTEEKFRQACTELRRRPRIPESAGLVDVAHLGGWDSVVVGDGVGSGDG